MHVAPGGRMRTQPPKATHASEAGRERRAARQASHGQLLLDSLLPAQKNLKSLSLAKRLVSPGTFQKQ